MAIISVRLKVLPRMKKLFLVSLNEDFKFEECAGVECLRVEFNA